MEISIRRMEMKDAAEVARLSSQFGYPATLDAVSLRLPALLASHVDWLWVAEAGGRVLGWIQATAMSRLESGAFVEITGLVVDEGHRSLGIGRRLVDAVLRLGEERSAPRVVVRSNVVRDRAHHFYLQIGFAEMKQQKVFEKRLDPQSDSKGQQ
jgi:N-acetylglutamate synthase-like GNAT family acetyltransferase